MNSALFNVLTFSIFWAIQIFISKLAFRAGAQIMPFTIQSTIVAIFLLASYVFIFKKIHIGKLSREIFLVAEEIARDRFGTLKTEVAGYRKHGVGVRFIDPVYQSYGSRVRRAGGDWDEKWMNYVRATARTVDTAIRHDFELRERLGPQAGVFRR